MDHLLINARFNNQVLMASAEDLKDEHFTARPHGFHSAAWILEHLSCYRVQFLERCGVTPAQRVDEKLFGMGCDAEECIEADADTIRQRCAGLGEALLDSLENLDEAAWSAEAKHIGNGQPTTFAANLTFWFWHESYHTGQLGLLRKALGYPTFA